MTKLIKIDNPCSENWDKMKIGINSRFCQHCDKHVVDFTNKNRIEILEYLINHRSESICGRIKQSQLDFVHHNWCDTVKAFSKQTKNSNLPFFLLTVGSLMLASCHQKNSNISTLKTSIDTSILQNDKFDVKDVEKDTIKPTKNKLDKHSNFEKSVTMGLILLDDTTINEPELYPEFIGGIDSLYNFIDRHLTYPEYEKENKIQGEVVVVFIIDENGKIKEPKILKTVENSKNFDAEVLRVIQLMPNWIPGKRGGRNAKITVSIPIHFELN